MRLIDARIAVAELAKFMAYEANMENCAAGYHHTKDDFIDVAKELIENVPTIEAEPVRRGRWVWSALGVACSVCGCKLQTTGIPRFCSNCGARMDGE